MLRWFALAALVALAAASGVSAADAQQHLATKDISGDFPNIGGSGGNLAGTITGMWSDGTTLWVMEDIDIRHTVNSAHATNDTGRILAYHLENLTRNTDSSKNFLYLAGAATSGNSDNNRSPDGIYSDGKTMWVGDSIQSPVKVFAYNMITREHDSAKDFNIGSDPLRLRGPTGMWGDGTTLWIADYPDGIYAFDITKSRPTYKHEEISAATRDKAENDNAWGIWSDGTIMWVADDVKDKVFAYRMSDKVRVESREFDLHKDNHGPTGLYSDGKTMWVLDNGQGVSPNVSEKIFVYKLPQPPAPPAPAPAPRVFVIPPDTTPPTVKSVERTGNATTTNHTLTWNVKFSESVRVSTVDIHTNRTSIVNATIPDLGSVNDAILMDIPGTVSRGSVSVDLEHFITGGLLIELVAPDCTKFTIHNQTTTFPYKLRQPYDLGDLSGIGAAGQWELHVSDHAKYWNGTLNGWTLELNSRGAIEGGGRDYTITQYVAGPGEYALSLDGYNIRDWAGNRLKDTEPAVNEPYQVVGAAVRTCQAE